VRARPSEGAAYTMVLFAGLWKITDVEACALLGFPGDQWAEMKAEKWKGCFSEADSTRISAIAKIFNAPHRAFSDALANEWICLPNKGLAFGGQRPLDYMVAGGSETILTTRRYVEAVAQGLLIDAYTEPPKPMSDDQARKPPLSDDEIQRRLARASRYDAQHAEVIKSGIPGGVDIIGRI
jgi:hypothetical protein